MTALLDPYDAALAVGATGLLRLANEAGVIAAADVHVATRLGVLGGESDERVLLAVALAVRAVRGGSVCVDLRSVAAIGVDGLSPADPESWADLVAASPLVATADTHGSDDAGSAQPLRLVGELLYLDRYWRQEQSVRDELARRAAAAPPTVDLSVLRTALAAEFRDPAPDQQRLAAAAVALGWLTVVAGGPGTGKTTTVAALLRVLERVLSAPPRVALAAPTGRAAARLQEAVGRPASTVHRLLGWKPGSRSRFRHDATHRLPFDVVVVDETSMVSLTLMCRLLAAVRPDARVVLVGDPDQLASVDAGAVLGDLVGRPARSTRDQRTRLLLDALGDDLVPREEVLRELGADVVRLRHNHRFADDSPIARLAEAVRLGDAETALAVLAAGGAGRPVEFVPLADDAPSPAESAPVVAAVRPDAVAAGTALHAAAVAGHSDAALDALGRHRLLCAHRTGPYGIGAWGAAVERWLAEELPGFGAGGEWHLGRPLLLTANDPGLGLANGDVGVVLSSGDRVVAVFQGPRGPVTVSPTRLSAVETVHAMTVHKSQGSQVERVTVVLPPTTSPLLTRELLYTAVTRASAHVRVVGSPEAVRAAVQRPIRRASGLRHNTTA